MGWPFGVKLVNESLTKLRDEVVDFYGALNEVRANARSAKNLPEEPDAMYLYKKCKSMGIPLVAGGLLDQPHIWLLEWNIVEQQTLFMESLPSLSGDKS